MKIRVVIAVFSILFVTMAVRSYAQSGLAGSWIGTEGKGKDALAVSIQLNVRGNVLSGTHTVTFTGGKQECQIENGKVEGRLFSFECELSGKREFKLKLPFLD